MTKKTWIISMIAVVIVLAAEILMTAAEERKQTWDVSYGMANAKITWQKTWHGGVWNSD